MLISLTNPRISADTAGRPDQRLDFLRGEARGFRQHGDGRPVQVGEDINGHPGELVRPADDERQRGQQDHEAVFQGEGDDVVEHGGLLADYGVGGL